MAGELDVDLASGKRACAATRTAMGRRWVGSEKGVETTSATGQPARRRSGFVGNLVTNSIQAKSQCSGRPSSTVGRRREGVESNIIPTGYAGLRTPGQQRFDRLARELTGVILWAGYVIPWLMQRRLCPDNLINLRARKPSAGPDQMGSRQLIKESGEIAQMMVGLGGCISPADLESTVAEFRDWTSEIEATRTDIPTSNVGMRSSDSPTYLLRQTRRDCCRGRPGYHHIA
ncbi:hypothetical protein FHL15_001327 [Xylaria flabelliformis]|uniref:Uncharacterized protein n=1 Tax=Xylaria flabelliformis TaxID=2512241 RepID=A0A553IBK6_9PEZI|nr:hypothetical protein FHL15_001327 [Xylaria flabelliformis]